MIPNLFRRFLVLVAAIIAAVLALVVLIGHPANTVDLLAGGILAVAAAVILLML